MLLREGGVGDVGDDDRREAAHRGVAGGQPDQPGGGDPPRPAKDGGEHRGGRVD